MPGTASRSLSLLPRMLLVACLLILLPDQGQAQGDGPRVHLPAPTGINPVSLTWMGMDSNFNFAGSILIPDSGVEASVWALNYNRLFNVGGRLAELWVTGIGGSDAYGDMWRARLVFVL